MRVANHRKLNSAGLGDAEVSHDGSLLDQLLDESYS